MPGEVVRLIVNLTESRITREMALWAGQCRIILMTLIDVPRCSNIMTVGRTRQRLPGHIRMRKQAEHYDVLMALFPAVTSCLKLLLA